MHIIDSCIAATGRTYPDGYGFAIAYLDRNLGPDQLKVLQSAAWRAVERQTKAGNRDALAFVRARSESADCRYWMIEAAQLVLADALQGNATSRNAMRVCGHPGY